MERGQAALHKPERIIKSDGDLQMISVPLQ